MFYEKGFFLLLFCFFLIFPSKLVFSDSMDVSLTVTGTAVYAFSGYAAPNSVVTFLEDGVSVGTTTADSNGAFTKEIEETDEESHTFSYYYTDSLGNTSSTLTQTLSTTINDKEEVSNIVAPPTLELADSSVTVSENITISGYTIPNASVSVTISSDSVTKTTTSDSNGLWSVAFAASISDSDSR